MVNLRQWLRRPSVGVRALAAVFTVAALLPLLARLPKVAVVACFEAGHPLYQWVPITEFGGGCVTTSASVVGWTLMVAATLLVQLVLLPFILTAAAFLVRSARRLARSASQALVAALVQLSELFVPDQRPGLVPVPISRSGPGLSRENPRRGPPACLS